MKGFETTGRMTVEKFERLFQAEFGVYCDLIDQKGNFADESATLASLRPDDFEGPKKVDFSLRANMQVGNVIKKVKENFGIDIIIYELAEPEEKSTLASVSKFTYLKQQKKIAHNSDELDKIVASLEDEDDVEDLGTKYYELSIKGHDGEIQIFRLNKEEAESLRESYEEDEENFLSDNLNGGDFFEEPIIEAVYSVDIFDAELKDENGNEIKISDQQIEINEQIESSDLYENYTLNYYNLLLKTVHGALYLVRFR